MNTENLLVRLMVDGLVVVPDVLNEEEVQEARDAFERKAAEHQKSSLSWEQLRSEPIMVDCTLHPKLMDVADAYVDYYGHENVLCCHNGARDAGRRDKYDAAEEAALPAADDIDRRTGAGWHVDGACLKEVSDTFANASLTMLLYFDDTYANNGAFVAAVGSHHLHFAFGGNDGKCKYPDSTFILDNCELRPVFVKAGSAIIFRTQTWHGVLPALMRHRRLMVQCLCSKELYSEMHGHNIDLAEKEFLPNEKHKYLTSYP